MDGALEVLRVGCDKEDELEADFVYWVPSTEAVREEAAERVIAKIDKLGGSEKKRLQKVARAVVEKKLTSVLIDMPVFFQDSLLVVVRSWLQKHLYEVLDELFFEEEAMSLERLFVALLRVWKMSFVNTRTNGSFVKRLR